MSDYSIAAAKRKLFKSEERTNNKNVCSCVCSLCAKETNLYILFVETRDPLIKRISSKRAKESFFHQKLLSWQKSRPFFSPFFSLLSLFFKRTRDTFETKESTYLHSRERERSARQCSYTSRKESFCSRSCSPSTKTSSTMRRRIWPSALRLLKEKTLVKSSPSEQSSSSSESLNLLVDAVVASLKDTGVSSSGGSRRVIAREDVMRFLSSSSSSSSNTNNDRLIENYARIDGTKDASTSSSSDDNGGNERKKKVVVVNSEFEDVPNSAIRKVIASRLLASKRAQPHSYVTMDVDASGVDRFRKKAMQEHETKVSVNDCILYAASKALRRVGKVNSRYDEKLGERMEFDTVDISVAVAAPSGLVTPIVFNADNKSVSEIGQDVRRLAGKAKDGKLKPSEMIGGSFTISNLGMFSVDSFQAIQNPPQGAILAVGRGTERVVISKSARSDSSSNDEDGDVDKPATGALFSEDQLSTQLSISATLSIDNRCMDEADASEWLEAFADEMRKAEDFEL